MHSNGFFKPFKGFFVEFRNMRGSRMSRIEDSFETIDQMRSNLGNTVYLVHDMIFFLSLKLYLPHSEIFENRV